MVEQEGKAETPEEHAEHEGECQRLWEEIERRDLEADEEKALSDAEEE